MGFLAGFFVLFVLGACLQTSPGGSAEDPAPLEGSSTLAEGVMERAVVSGPGERPGMAARPILLEETSEAKARIAALRQRFLLKLEPPAGRGARSGSRPDMPALGTGVATAFESDGEAGVRAILPLDPRPGSRLATGIELPRHANGHVRIEDPLSHARVRFVLRDARPTAVAVAEGFALYSGALPNADLVHRAHLEGSEDFVIFESPPAREELVYSVDVSRVAGLRLVSNTLEFLDEGGAPRLRVAPPYAVNALGVRHPVRLSISGCAYDARAAGPWGRPVIRPGAASCEVRVAWSGLTYPVLVDPQWTTTHSMAVARDHHVARVLASGQLLVAGGYGAGVEDSAELYDPGSDTFAVTGRMTVPRQSHTASVLASGEVLIAGGQTSRGDHLSSAELYDLATGEFTPTGSMTSERAGGTATVLGSGNVLFTGGWNAQGAYLSSAELYNPTREVFEPTGSLGTGRADHTASLLLSGKVLVAGGSNRSLLYPSAELYDPGTGTFAPTGSMASRRYLHTASVLASGKVLIVGGMGGGSVHLSSAELYDPASGTFAPTGSMTTPRRAHTASVLASGKVLVVGGYIFTNLSSAELYDPASGTFAPTGSMAATRSYHSTRVLLSGNVLVAGGWRPDIGPLSSTEMLFTAAGQSCTTGDDCGSGTCRNGVCCATVCTGGCNMCARGSGACISDPKICTGNTTCGAAGVCKLNDGQACLSASACLSGHCVDGYCCNTACSGGCERCNARRGTCTPSAAGDPGSASCSPFLCDGKSGACPISCARDADCVSGTVCAPSTHSCAVPEAPSGPGERPAAPSSPPLETSSSCSASVARPSPAAPWAFLGGLTAALALALRVRSRGRF